MKISPLTLNDPWLNRAISDPEAEPIHLKNLPVSISVDMELVEILHEESTTNYKPYLHLRGEVSSVTPSVELPYGVDELLLRRGSGMTIDAFYDFDAQQLRELVAKGYFTESFRVPDELTQVTWTLPSTATFTIVGPDTLEDAPLVFMGIDDQAKLGLDRVSLGDAIAQYFPDYTVETQQDTQTEAAPQDDDLQRASEVSDIFADVAFTQEDQQVAAEAGTTTAATQEAAVRRETTVFDTLVAAIKERHAKDTAEATEPDTTAEATEESAGHRTAEDIYATVVAPAVDRALHEQVEAATSADEAPVEEAEEGTVEETPAGYIDFNDDTEADAAEQQSATTAGATDDRTNRGRAIRRIREAEAESQQQDSPFEL